jgi:murein DD-endopeptidase MepM/ murein hydrolase activator NlpD
LLPPGAQIAAMSCLIAIVAAISYLSVDRIGRDRLITETEAALVRAETANGDLQQEAARLRDMLAAALRARDQAEARLDTVEAAPPKPGPGRGPYKARLEPATKKLQGGPFQLAGLIMPETVQPAGEPPPPVTLISDAPPEMKPDSESVAEMGRRAVGEFGRMLASTGLNIERLFPQFDPRRAEGGPFVPPPKPDHTEGIGRAQLEAMRSLMRSLPLAVPLDQYQLESRFGPRRDPFNRRPSFHTGIDLSAPYMSPVYATAGGVVAYAGWRSEYGKVVEIAHGNGIVTLYGHLHRAIVSVGQSVAEHTQIGFLGSTGRSSGPHVHYEILVNDEPQDPEKFIGLARVIPAAAER